jgi:hypothetical protein
MVYTSVFIAINDAVRINCALTLLKKQLRSGAHKNIASTVLCILGLHLKCWNTREDARECSARMLEGPRTRAIVARVGIHMPMNAVCSMFLLTDAKAPYAREFARVLHGAFCARELLRIRMRVHVTRCEFARE